VIVVDAHLDLAMNALQWNRDLRLSAYVIRTLEQKVAGKGRGLGTVALPELRRGRVALAFATLIARSTGRPVPHIDYSSTAQAYGVAQGQLAYYRALERQGYLRFITDAARLEAHLNEWFAWDSVATSENEPPPLGVVLSMEGADPIETPEQLESWWQAGLRLLGPTHYGPGRYAGGTGTELGLSELGRPLLAEMARLGVALDLTHLSDQAFWEALEYFDGPVLASHNNCRVLVPHQRQFSDTQLKAIFERDGVVGVAFDAWMLTPGWTLGNREATLEAVVDHLDHLCQLAGSSRHAALGTDLDGGFGREQSPVDLDTVADLQRIPELLIARGYGGEDIEAIMHGNWLRFLRRIWGG
jgi:membrane dipeptidase